MHVQVYFTITLMYFELLWYIHVNKVYRPILKCSNLLMKHSQKDMERGNKFSFRGCLVTIRDASYIFQLILVIANIQAYFSYLKKIAL